jgi:hypothetical protein
MRASHRACAFSIVVTRRHALVNNPLKRGTAMASTQDPTAPGTSEPYVGRKDPESKRQPVTDETAPAEAIKDIGTRLGELGEYVSYYLTAKIDGLKATGRNIVIYVALGVMGAFAGAAAIVTLVVLTLVGIAHGIGDMLGDRWWLGDLITGILFLSVMGVGVVFGIKKLTGSSRERTVKKYAARQQQERVQYGTDVQQRAQDPAE